MFAFIARQPILTRSKDLYAYDLLFRDGKNGAYPEHDTSRNSSINARFNTLSIDDISGDKRAFVNFLPDTLIHRFPDNLTPDTVVIELEHNPIRDKALQTACEKLKNQGFDIALRADQSQLPDFIPSALIDIIKLDVGNSKDTWLQTIAQQIARSETQLVAEHVSNLDDFSNCKELGFDYFQGYFFTQPSAHIAKTLPASSLTLLELMAQCTQDDFDFDKVSEIIQRDASLSFLLMRFINNPAINKRERIGSLSHAITYLGEIEVKKFIALLSLASLNQEKPLELLQVSLVRAKFCELVERQLKGADESMSAFLVGLFSLLDTILEQDMGDVLTKLPLTSDIQNALLGQTSRFDNYLPSVKAFESGLWGKVISLSESMQVSQKDLHAMFNDAIKWANQMRRAMSEHFPRTQVNASKP